jgi:hypothetical protein
MGMKERVSTGGYICMLIIENDREKKHREGKGDSFK